mgnify:CR=1 FL=1
MARHLTLAQWIEIGAPHLIRPAATFSPSDAEKGISPIEAEREGAKQGASGGQTSGKSSNQEKET